jgi:hypothetical protein
MSASDFAPRFLSFGRALRLRSLLLARPCRAERYGTVPPGDDYGEDVTQIISEEGIAHLLRCEPRPAAENCHGLAVVYCGLDNQACHSQPGRPGRMRQTESTETLPIVPKCGMFFRNE